MSLPEAARKLGMHTCTLRRRVKAKEIRAVKIGPRSYIPSAEIGRLLDAPTEQTELKPDTANSVSGDSTKACETEQNDADLTAKTPKERLDEILAGYADFVAAYTAGDPDALAAVAAVGSPDECARAREAYAHAIRVWREYRE